MNEKSKPPCGVYGQQGTILFYVFCKQCDFYHPQWKFPCDCEHGKITVDPLGYKLCDKCNGRGWNNAPPTKTTLC